MISFNAALEIARMRWAQGSTTAQRSRSAKGTKAVRTRQVYDSNVRRLLREVGLVETPQGGPDESLARYELVVRRLKVWRAEQQQHYEDGDLSASKVRGDRCALVAFYDALVPEKIYEKNPALEITGLAPDQGLPRPFTDLNDVDKLFAQPDVRTWDGLRDRLMLELFYHAFRNSEACGLSVGSLNWDGSVRGFIAHVVGKGGKVRLIPLRPDTSERIARYIVRRFSPTSVVPQARVVQEARHLMAKHATKPLFPYGPTERAITSREVSRWFVGYREAAGLPKTFEDGSPIGAHTLRHTCLTELLKKTGDLRKVQEVAGHSDIRQTQLYTLVLPEGRRTRWRSCTCQRWRSNG